MFPDGYSLRPGSAEDLDAVATLAAVTDMADYGRVTMTRADLEDMCRLPRFSHEQGSWIVTDRTGGIAAYGWLWLRTEPHDSSAFAFVHPAHRGRGLGSALARLLEARAREITVAAAPGTAMFRQAISGTEPGARALFESMGYTVARHFFRMEADLEPALPPADPPGIRIRTVTGPDEAPVVHLVVDEAMTDHWNHSPEPYEDFAARRLPKADFGLWWLAFDGDQPAGALIGAVENDAGWVAQLAVRRGYRRRGIGLALLGHAFTTFAERGVRKAELQVDGDSPTGATVLYEKAGMRRAFFWTFMEKRLR